ncbi:hypothetical protein EYC80_006596 [Monilinia laxa]|uniref:Uncharacterized protein n=1 Tax=Monilinia laxa TaxID=61186 RepID=A0A5N6JSE7_MONLA|nr:hypothetical protein EYC80_006596 [Monilinia laxa]
MDSLNSCLVPSLSFVWEHSKDSTIYLYACLKCHIIDPLHSLRVYEQPDQTQPINQQSIPLDPNHIK